MSDHVSLCQSTRNLEKGEVCFGSQYEGYSHHGGEGMVGEMGSGCLPCILSYEAGVKPAFSFLFSLGLWVREWYL